MNKYFKIKVGIEEFPILESDIPRIVEAMKKNEMVKLEHGIFRGQAILAITRDLEKEESELRASVNSTYSDKEKEIEETIKKQIAECTSCGQKGYTIINKVLENGHPNPVVKKCSCTIYRGVVEMPLGSSPE